MHPPIVIDSGRLRIEILPFGAHLIGVWFPDRTGDRGDNLVHRLANLDDYRDPATNIVFGSTIGRYANRIGSARFDLDQVTYDLEPNDGSNHIHGAGEFSFRPWSIDEQTDTAVQLSLLSPAGECGYPGTLRASVTYSIVGDDALCLSYRATSEAPTVVNLTNHAYWNLAGRGTVLDHLIEVNATHYVETDDDLIPTGNLLPVDGTSHDFRRSGPIRDRLRGGIDDCYMGRALKCRLREAVTGRSMIVTTDQPGMQIYTANSLKPPHTFVCLETQLPPDSPNRPEFPSPILRVGETYVHETTHTFES